MASIRRLDSHSDDIDLDVNLDFIRSLGLDPDEADRFMKLYREKTYSTALANTLIAKVKARRASRPETKEEEEERRALMGAKEVAEEADHKSEEDRLMKVLLEHEKVRTLLAIQNTRARNRQETKHRNREVKFMKVLMSKR